MLVLRCTRKLLRRLRQEPVEHPPDSTTVLGGFHANVLWVYRKPIILAVSERTLLPVLVPARDPGSLGARLSAGLGEMLGALGIAGEQIRAERMKMTEIVFAKTDNRQILGTMNDFDRMLEPALGQSLTSAALKLAEAPCGPIGMESPNRATIAAFASSAATSRSSDRLELHALDENGMVVCNPRDREAAHRAQVEGIATERRDAVTCSKCLSMIGKESRRLTLIRD